MRKSFAITALFLFSGINFSQESRNVTTKINQVVVYFSGAQVTRAGSAALNPGTTKVVFTDLPYNMNPQSIQLTGTGAMTLLSVNHQYNYLNQLKKSEELVALQQQKEGLQEKLNFENNMLEVYVAEEAMLKTNQDIKGTQTGLSVIELKNAVDYFRARMIDIRTKKLEQNKKIKKLQEDNAKIDGQISQISAASSTPTSEVVATIIVKIAVNATFSLSYYFGNAGWSPNYDIRVENISSPVNLTYKANVFQRSGEKWDNVKLWLSTANPSFDGTKPVLNPWYLDFYVPVKNSYGAKRKSAMDYAGEAAPSAKMSVESEMKENVVLMDQVQSEVQIQTTSFMYKIAEPYDITGDGKSYIVIINEMDIPATYEYYCAPKIDKDAFLLAHITGWQDFNLLSGDANLFFEGTYVGKSSIDVASTKDTLDFSLGRDKGIVVERKQEKDLSEKAVMGIKRKVNKAWTIQVRNNKKIPIDIIIDDQFPISNNAQIKVDQGEHKGAELNSVTGILTWKMNIKPGESQKVGFKYSVEYPKDMTVIVE